MCCYIYVSRDGVSRGVCVMDDVEEKYFRCKKVLYGYVILVKAQRGKFFLNFILKIEVLGDSEFCERSFISLINSTSFIDESCKVSIRSFVRYCFELMMLCSAERERNAG